MHLSDLKSKPVTELVEIANTNEIDGANRMRKHDLIFALLKNQAKKGESIFGDGTLEVLQDGFGFLRSPDLARFFRIANINSCLRIRLALSISRPAAMSSSAETWSALSSDSCMDGSVWKGGCGSALGRAHGILRRRLAAGPWTCRGPRGCGAAARAAAPRPALKGCCR